MIDILLKQSISCVWLHECSYTELVPLQIENQWQGNDRFEAQVANQMLRNYMFVGEMVFNGIKLIRGESCLDFN